MRHLTVFALGVYNRPAGKIIPRTSQLIVSIWGRRQRMGKIVITDVAAAPLQAFDGGEGVSAQGAVQTRSIVADAGRPLWLRQQELAAGATLSLEVPPVEHLFYVLE